MSDVNKVLREHLATKGDWSIGSDEEWSYSIGQLVEYMRFKLQNATHLKRPMSEINPFLNAESKGDPHQQIMDRLVDLYKKANSTIKFGEDEKFSSLLAKVVEYQPKEIDYPLIMAGFVGTNWLFDKVE